MGSALLETMTAQVTEQCDANRAAAQQEAEAIHAEATEQAQARRDALTAANDAEMNRLDERWRLMAHAEASRADLVVKNDAVQAVMQKVESEIRAVVDSAAFGGVLDALLTSLLNEYKGEDIEAVLIAPQAHVAHVQQWLSANGHAGMSVEGSAEVWDGVALQDPARTYRISNTLTGRYARIGQEARRLCMVKLFGETTEGVQ